MGNANQILCRTTSDKFENVMLIDNQRRIFQVIFFALKLIWGDIATCVYLRQRAKTLFDRKTDRQRNRL